MFAGSHLLTVDDKGRLAIPARFRQKLTEKFGPQVFITRSYQPCVEIYPATTFNSIVDGSRPKAAVMARSSCSMRGISPSRIAPFGCQPSAKRATRLSAAAV